MAAQQQPKHGVRSEEETFWGQEWEVGATHRSTECRPGQPGWRTQLSKESPPRSPVGGGLGSEGPCRGPHREGVPTARPYLGSTVALITGLGDIVDILPTSHEAGVHVGHFPLHQLGTRRGSTGQHAGAMFLSDTPPSHSKQVSSGHLRARPRDARAQLGG